MRAPASSRLLGTTLGTLALWAGVPAGAGASFTIAPPSSTVTTPAGSTAFGSFSVLATESRRETFDLAVAVVSETAERGVAVTPDRAAREWLRVSPRTIRPRRDRFRVRWLLAVPDGASPGDHVLAVVVRRRPRAGKATYSAAQAVAHRITVRVPGAIRKDVAITNLEAPSLVGGGPVTATAEIVNRGNVAIDLGGRDGVRLAVVREGKEVARARVDGALVPGGSRRVRLTWQDPPRLGQARIEARAPMAGGGAELSSVVTVIPWRESLSAVLLMAGLFLLLRLLKTRVRFQVVR